MIPSSSGGAVNHSTVLQARMFIGPDPRPGWNWNPALLDMFPIAIFWKSTAAQYLLFAPWGPSQFLACR
jgi:hypothetical protein